MSELKRYLDRLANGRLLDSVTSAGRHLRLHAEEGSEVDGAALAKRRIAIRDSYLKAAPLKVRRTRGKNDAR